MICQASGGVLPLAQVVVRGEHLVMGFDVLLEGFPLAKLAPTKLTLVLFGDDAGVFLQPLNGQEAGVTVVAAEVWKRGRFWQTIFGGGGGRRRGRLEAGSGTWARVHVGSARYGFNQRGRIGSGLDADDGRLHLGVRAFL
uniref:(northern house mosquito) hypothetical protein n=1 Tax=Culex pipiens TaxID=7175 RepID=A0A8D8BFM8_CULPI